MPLKKRDIREWHGQQGDIGGSWLSGSPQEDQQLSRNKTIPRELRAKGWHWSTPVSQGWSGYTWSANCTHPQTSTAAQRGFPELASRKKKRERETEWQPAAPTLWVTSQGEVLCLRGLQRNLWGSTTGNVTEGSGWGAHNKQHMIPGRAIPCLQCPWQFQPVAISSAEPNHVPEQETGWGAEIPPDFKLLNEECCQP